MKKDEKVEKIDSEKQFKIDKKKLDKIWNYLVKKHGVNFLYYDKDGGKK